MSEQDLQRRSTERPEVNASVRGEKGPSGERLAQTSEMLQASPAVARLRQRAGTLQRRANGSGLPDPLRSGIEALSGRSLAHVKVHYNSSRPAQLNALAYAQGSDIHLSPGQERHLPHEGWHLVQQMQGRVKPTSQANGVSINDDTTLEREADVMGARALHTAPADATSRVVEPEASSAADAQHPAQRSRAEVLQLQKDDPAIAKLREELASSGTKEMQFAVNAFLADTGHGTDAPAQKRANGSSATIQRMALAEETTQLLQDGPIQRVVAQLYTDLAYVPDLTGLHVPHHHSDGGAFNYGARPAGWYDGTLEELLARAITRVEGHEQQVYCPLIRQWRPANDMQIGHIQKWEDYVRSKGPANRREGINAYNDLNNLRLESALPNESHDFEELWEINNERYDTSDGFVVDDGEMDANTRRLLDIELERLRRPRLVLDHGRDRVRRRNLMDEVGEYLQRNMLRALLVAGLLTLYFGWLIGRYL